MPTRDLANYLGTTIEVASWSGNAHSLVLTSWLWLACPIYSMNFNSCPITISAGQFVLTHPIRALWVLWTWYPVICPFIPKWLSFLSLHSAFASSEALTCTFGSRSIQKMLCFGIRNAPWLINIWFVQRTGPPKWCHRQRACAQKQIHINGILALLASERATTQLRSLCPMSDGSIVSTVGFLLNKFGSVKKFQFWTSTKYFAGREGDQQEENGFRFSNCVAKCECSFVERTVDILFQITRCDPFSPFSARHDRAWRTDGRIDSYFEGTLHSPTELYQESSEKTPLIAHSRCFGLQRAVINSLQVSASLERYDTLACSVHQFKHYSLCNIFFRPNKMSEAHPWNLFQLLDLAAMNNWNVPTR